MVRLRAVAAFAAVAVALSGCAWVGRVGVSSSGVQPASGTTIGTSVSADGHYVVFTSSASNLVPNDTNNASDVFLRDNQTGTTELISVSSTGVQGDQGGYGGLVSADGRYVAFTSDSTNLVANDTNASTDVFLRDRTLKTTTRVSLRSGGTQADGSSYLSSMTPDAGLVVFDSFATDLIGTADTNGVGDVYIRDRVGSTTKRLSIATDGTEGDLDSYGGSISNDGRYVVFASDASTLDPADSGSFADVYLRDRTLNTTTRISVLADGTETDGDSYNPQISGDGKVVAFETDASNLDPNDDGFNTDVYATVLGSKTFERISVADPSRSDPNPDDYSFLAGLSGDGRYVLFESAATNLLKNDLSGQSNSFLRDRTANSTALVATSAQGGEPTGATGIPAGSTPNAITADGHYVLFTSTGVDVATPDTNGSADDVFLRSNPVPFIFAVSPNSLARGATATVTLLGTNLQGKGALVTFGDGVTVNSVTPISDSQVQVSVTVAANATPGPRTPVILQTGAGGPGFSGGLAFLPSAFTVT